MHTNSHATIVAVMARPGDMEPWNWAAWAERTNHVIPPFSTDAQPDDTFSQRQLDEIRAYVLALQKKRPRDRFSFAMNGQRDKYQAGRAAWSQWVEERWTKQWRFDALLDRVLKNNGATAYEVMRAHRTDELPDIEDADLDDLHKEIVSEIFGIDAFINPYTARLPIKKNVKEFVQGALRSTWDRYRRTVSWQRKQMKANMAKETKLWAKMTEDDAKPTAAQMRTWVRLSNSLMVPLKNYSDEESVSQLEKKKEMITAMLAAIGPEQDAVRSGKARTKKRRTRRYRRLEMERMMRM
ncbi:hypothetical protein D9615_006229 [Tricholomella constricta]|uniref:Uncharacterized protein n=1 Tax=Tricholomella constricta TaxID=117010 RepID=A0A8H5M454_9AGAR|nr:hypothetical protein D9615_006229 [Tricholomella constricta]